MLTVDKRCLGGIAKKNDSKAKVLQSHCFVREGDRSIKYNINYSVFYITFI